MDDKLSVSIRGPQLSGSRAPMNRSIFKWHSRNCTHHIKERQLHCLKTVFKKGSPAINPLFAIHQQLKSTSMKAGRGLITTSLQGAYVLCPAVNVTVLLTHSFRRALLKAAIGIYIKSLTCWRTDCRHPYIPTKLDLWFSSLSVKWLQKSCLPVTLCLDSEFIWADSGSC